MKETTRKQIEEMKNQTIGVEIEMYGIERREAARIAAIYFGTGRCKDTAAENGYCFTGVRKLTLVKPNAEPVRIRQRAIPKNKIYAKEIKPCYLITLTQ